MNKLEYSIDKFSETINSRTGWFVIFLLALNIGLKFTFIGDKSLWIDEAYYAYQAATLSAHEIIFNFARDPHPNPPLYLLMLHYWVKIVGDSETALRSLSAIFSTATVILVFFFARKYLSAAGAVYSSILLSISNAHLYHSHDARNYAFVSLLFMLAIIFFFRNKEHYALQNVIALTIINALIIYASPIAVMALGAQFLCAVIFLFRDKKFAVRILISLAGAFVLFLPWLFKVVNSIPVEGKFWLTKPNFYNFMGIFVWTAGNEIVLVMEFLIICSCLIYIYYNNFRMHHFDLSSERITIISIWFLFPIIASYLISQYTPVFYSRYLLYTSIASYLLVGISIDRLPSRKTTRLVIFSFLLIPLLLSININPTKHEDWKGLVKKYTEIKKEGDSTLLSGTYTVYAFAYYYNRELFTEIKNNTLKIKEPGWMVKNRLDDADLPGLEKSNRVITVQSSQPFDDPNKTVQDVLEKKFDRESDWQFEEIKLSVFEKRQ